LIRVVLVDDQMLVRRGIKSLLELSDDIVIVADAASAEEAAAIIGRERPDVVLLDVRMPGKDGIELLRELHTAAALPPTILLTTFDDDEALFEGIKAGARGYLLKDVSLESLTAAIRSVAAGETLIRPAITERMIRGLEKFRGRSATPIAAPDALTRRELEILRLMAGGYSNREIADALGTAEGTIKNHTSSILSKLGVRDRTRAVLKALEMGCL
jgi:DNA-binding NarL/FixJ family response regulator